MDQLISRVIQGRASRTEEAELLQWRQASSENEQYYRQLLRLLREAESAAWERVPTAVPPSTFFTGREGPTRSRWFRLRRGSLGLGLAALGAAAAIALVVLEFGGLGPDVSGQLLFGTGEVATGASETATVTLGDGTVVRLAPHSRLRITPQPGSREVWLEGRAFFAVVSQGKSNPFRVRTHAGDAMVLGTRFDLQARSDDLQLLVVEGAVNLDSHGVAIDVGGSQLARVEGDGPPVREDVDQSFLAEQRKWLGNFLVFEDTPLSQAAVEIGAHYGVPVEILDDTLANVTVSGMFADEELDDVVAALCRAVSAYCSVQPAGVKIGP
jgi:transmembrane sensor